MAELQNSDLIPYQDEEAGGVLLLIDLDNNAVFDKVGKCKDVFFGGKHLEKEEFDSE